MKYLNFFKTFEVFKKYLEQTLFCNFLDYI